MGGTYRSARLPVRGPPATGRFHKKSTVSGRLKGEIDRRWSVEREKGTKKKRKKKKKKEKRRKRIPIARARSSPVRRRRPRVAGALSPVRGERSRRHFIQLSPAQTQQSEHTNQWFGLGMAVFLSWLHLCCLSVQVREGVKIEHEKKLSTLQSQEYRRKDDMKLDKTKASIQKLHSLIIVTSQAVTTTSSAITKVRDDELAPQLVEMCYA
ncbi:hypothetical protein GW17_00031139 [Ensete ventricosum]|nr:hypothetical protein GW17_00031139 [Ensete ventricosum]